MQLDAAGRASTRCCSNFLCVSDRRRAARRVRRARALPRRGDRRRRRARRARRVRHAHARDARASEAKRAERAYADGDGPPARGPPARRQGPLRHRGRAHDLRLEDLRRPRPDAPTPRRSAQARDAGAIVVGKTLTHEFAWGITSVNPHFPPCRNPWDPERVPGGSSGGSAVALATGAGGARARHRHRRLDPHPGRVLRRLRPQADVQTGSRPPASSRSPARSTTPARWRARPPTCGCFYEALDRTARRPSPRPGSRSAPTCTCARSSPASSARSTHAVHALDATSSRSTFDDAERLYPAYVAIQNAEAALAHADLFPPRRDEYGADVAAAPRERAQRHARRVRRGDRRARAHPRRPSRACSPPPTCCSRRSPASRPSRSSSRPAGLPRRRAALHRPAGPRRACRRAPCPSASTTSACRSASSSPARRWSEGRVLAAAEALFSATASARAGSASARDLRDPHPDLVLEAPAPVLAGLERADDRVLGRAARERSRACSGESSQQPTCPQVRQIRRCSQTPPVAQAVLAAGDLLRAAR